MARIPTEHDIQRAICIWLNKALKPGVVYWHTPNGGGRNVVEGVRFKQAGVKAGIPDLLFLWGGLYGLELKKPGGVLSPAQREMHPRLTAAGMVACETVDNLADARQVITSWGLVLPSVGTC